MTEKSVSEAIAYRRSVRVYDPEQPIETEVVKECIRQATLAPTSSNLQLWEFYHVTSVAAKKEMVSACLSQTASHVQQFVVAVARKDKWKERAKANLDFLKDTVFGARKKRYKKRKNGDELLH